MQPALGQAGGNEVLLKCRLLERWGVICTFVEWCFGKLTLSYSRSQQETIVYFIAFPSRKLYQNRNC